MVVKHGDNFCECVCVCVLTNNQMEWCDRQRGLGEISCRRKRINLPKGEERQLTTPKQKALKRKKKESWFAAEESDNTMCSFFFWEEIAEWVVFLGIYKTQHCYFYIGFQSYFFLKSRAWGTQKCITTGPLAYWGLIKTATTTVNGISLQHSNSSVNFLHVTEKQKIHCIFRKLSWLKWLLFSWVPIFITKISTLFSS